MEMSMVIVVFIVLVFQASVCYGIEIGYKMKAGDAPLESANKKFAFGFRTPEDSDGGMVKLAIWYQVSNETFVWTAMLKGEPLQVSSQNAELELKSSGLYVKDGPITMWSIVSDSCDACVASATMEDTGNFVLSNSTSKIVWQTFSHPTDTILPGQELIGNTSLVSGKYRLSMNQSSVGLYFDDYSTNESYWSIMNSQLDTVHAGPLSTPPRLVLYENGSLAFFDASGTSFYRMKYDNAQRYPVDYMSTETMMRRIKLESNGSLRSYSMAQGGNSWMPVWQSHLLECEAYGTCGPFGLCYYGPRKECMCPEGFHRINTTDEFAGCSRSFQLTPCNATSSTNVKMIGVSRAEYLGNDYYTSSNVTSLEECKDLCARECRCLAASYKVDGSGLCTLKTGGNNRFQVLYNGLQSPERGVIALIKVSSLDTSVHDRGNVLDLVQDVFTTHMNASTITPGKIHHRSSYLSKESHVFLVAFAIAEFVVFCLIALSMVVCWRKTTRQLWKQLAHEKFRGAVKYTYEQLQVATNNFAQKIGTGGFGSVYKGVLPDKTHVAIKNLEVATGAESQFKAEVTTLGRIHHVNLVRLLGYCAEGQHRLLVYEYMSNGSLDQLLQGGISQLHKVWSVRYSIAVGVARGLSYLHEECYEHILHCDIKPQNILLDKSMCAKVSDFGLAKLMARAEDSPGLGLTTIHGTRGYLAPEWISNRPITAKADVYSYGMVLLEILCGQQTKLTDSSCQLWAFEKCSTADWCSVADPNVVDGAVDWEQFERMFKASLWCIQSDANSRPTMSEVVKMLEKCNEELHMPPAPLMPEYLDKLSVTGSSSSAPESQSMLHPR